MAARWKEDLQLKADLEKYVCQGMTRKEILDFIQRDFSSYQWSIRDFSSYQWSI